MKRKYIIISIVTATLALTTLASVSAKLSSKQADLKQERTLKHDNIRAKNEEKAKNYKDSERPQIAETTTEIDLPEFPETKISKITDVGADVPLQATFIDEYNFTNRAFTPHNFVIAGSSKKNPTEGIIINIYAKPKTGERSTNTINIPNTGKITFKKISSDKKTITFETEKGNTGLFNVSNGTYTLN